MTLHELLHDLEMTVDGRGLRSDADFAVRNPATGTTFAMAPSLAPERLDHVFAAAAQAQQRWRRDDAERRVALTTCAAVLGEAAESLAPLLTAEQGKPLKDAVNEIRYAAMWLRYFADLETSRTVLRDDERGREEVLRRPLGVVAAITPWNYPVSLAFWKIAPALRAGNTIVVKPSPYTPLTTLALGRLLRGILPDGVLNVVSGVEPLGAAMVAHPVPRKVSFTGSTATGKQVALAAATDLKRVTLELGGNDPAIVLDDVDVATVAPRIFWGAFRNNGQVCFAAKRVYAHERVHDELVEALSEIARGVRVGDGAAQGVQLGPVNNEAQLRHVEDLVADARDRRARIVAGGTRPATEGYFWAPTVIDRIDDDARVVREEQFGPVLPVLRFGDEREAVDRANDSPFGLTASVWSADSERASQLAPELECGQVSINSHGMGVQPHLPFGGRKWSGIGVENGPWGLDAFCELQTVVGPGNRTATASEGSR